LTTPIIDGRLEAHKWRKEMSDVEMIEVKSRVSENERIFKWLVDGVEVADIALYADGLVEFSSKRSGDVVIERIGDEHEAVYTYKPEEVK
jgi:hypothetical protein